MLEHHRDFSQFLVHHLKLALSDLPIWEGLWRKQKDGTIRRDQRLTDKIIATEQLANFTTNASGVRALVVDGSPGHCKAQILPTSKAVIMPVPQIAFSLGQDPITSASRLKQPR